MTVLCYTCCFWFSLRLGSVISAIFSLLKAVGFLTFNIVLFQEDVTKGHIGKVLLNVFNESIVDFARRELMVLFCASVTLIGIYIVTCVLLLVGAISCSPRLCIPYLVVNCMWCLLDLTNYIVIFRYFMSLTFISADELHTSLFGIGYVIFYLTFFLLCIFFEMYLGLCVYSFTQQVKILRKELMQREFVPAIRLIFKTGQIDDMNVQNTGGYYHYRD